MNDGADEAASLVDALPARQHRDPGQGIRAVLRNHGFPGTGLQDAVDGVADAESALLLAPAFHCSVRIDDVTVAVVLLYLHDIAAAEAGRQLRMLVVLIAPADLLQRPAARHQEHAVAARPAGERQAFRSDGHHRITCKTHRAALGGYGGGIVEVL